MTSLYRTKNHPEPFPSSLFFRPQLSPITPFTRAIEESRSHATTNSSTFPWFVQRSNGAPAVAGSYFVDMLHGTTVFSVDENLVENGLHQTPLAGSASASTAGAPDYSRTFAPGPMTQHTAGLPSMQACADPFVHRLDLKSTIGGPATAKPTSADLEPPSSLLDRLNADQRDCSLQVWHKLPAHLRKISFDFPGPG